METRPADTTAPERLLELAVQKVDGVFVERFGARLFKDHSAESDIYRCVHRFTSVNENGFYRLMKDLTRFCVERLDQQQLKLLTQSTDKNLGSLKRLEQILNDCGTNGRESVRELVGIYELRHSDSHLPSSDVGTAMTLLGVSPEHSPMLRAKRAIESVASCFLRIAEILKN